MTASEKIKILVVDDESAICNLLCRFFSYNNYITASASDCASARQLFGEFHPDIVILDINLLDGTGFNLCQEMSQTGAIILILSSMKDPHSILKVFEKGADDYFVKPFNLAILKAKIEALLKRYNKQEIEQNKPNQKLVFGSLSIDPNTREVKVQDTIVNLTPLEFKLLYFLATHPFVIWDRSELVAQVWEREEQVEEERKVDIHIGHIRKKIGDQEGKLIKTIWGKGYKFEPSHSDELKLAELSP